MHPPAALRPAPSTCNVLVVEDEYVIANDLRLLLLESGYGVQGIADSVAEARQLLARQRPDIVLLDIYLKGKATGIDLAVTLEEEGIPFIYISANDSPSVLEAVKATQPSGYIVKPFREKDVLTALEIGRYRHAHGVEVQLRKEKTLQISLTEALAQSRPWPEKLLQTAALLQGDIAFDLMAVRYEHGDSQFTHRYYRTGFDEYQTLDQEAFLRLINLSAVHMPQLQELDKQFYDFARCYGQEAYAELCRQHPLLQGIAKTLHMESALVMPVVVGPGHRFILSFFSKQPDAYRTRHLALLDRLEQPVALTLERTLAFEEVARLSEQLRRENSYLQDEVKTTANFEEIIGTSPALLRVFNQVSQVAPTDTTVLILGESGTGKELFARAIHNLSARRDKILVKLNCAALPATLIESELFGHEKGAFTGAHDRRVGKFELAKGGTIFLDEIGELPLELQAKLLRVLQEKEIERLGSNTPIKTDVRVLVATNRELEVEVRAGRFRMDLYFRLAVFPLPLPPLRERVGDILALATYFAQKAARNIGKPFRGLAPGALAELLAYSWPGNIRELENIIEQSIIVSDGQRPLELGRSLVNSFFHPEAAQANALANPTRMGVKPSQPPKDLLDVKQLQQETEREYILSVLMKSNGRVRGSGGAAELLNLKPTTLEYRMEKLGIRKTITSSGAEA
ncbi:sigma 54-interacting transcriptional regulator [Hymenobacter negativus]|uniref:Sigma 54-interacting transcriptional regulator n=1 Tax=Hymenobacter negativus TaxID=2795026 RepID=A0ABS3QLV0_9BACT|nr:sigma 54-interacting transcriptional regulator [Hymenobacter negativus]MBO2012241.1 sigma 54-interacting transcriptional regulator [Hymenobacter negativus]